MAKCIGSVFHYITKRYIYAEEELFVNYDRSFFIGNGKKSNDPFY